MEAQHPGTGGATNLVVHLVLPLHLLVEEGFDVLPAREHHGLLRRRRRGGERRPPGPAGGALALPGLRVRQVVLLVVQHPRAHPSRGHGGRMWRRLSIRMEQLERGKEWERSATEPMGEREI